MPTEVVAATPFDVPKSSVMPAVSGVVGGEELSKQKFKSRLKGIHKSAGVLSEMERTLEERLNQRDLNNDGTYSRNEVREIVLDLLDKEQQYTGLQDKYRKSLAVIAVLVVACLFFLAMAYAANEASKESHVNDAKLQNIAFMKDLQVGHMDNEFEV